MRGKLENPVLFLFSVLDHPRVCGENSAFQNQPCAPLGSPPRVRGKHCSPLFRPSAERITPACAGKTVDRHIHSIVRPDHPRVCGENPCRRRARSCRRGSPPRVRGKPSEYLVKQVQERITPACAGKTMKTQTRRGRRTDHPRVCGENRSNFNRATVADGSPPRVRGKLLKGEKHMNNIRITPACAGKTVKGVSIL